MDKKEWEILYKKYYQPLFFYAFSLTQNWEDAEDLVANTFVKVFTCFEFGNLRAWMYTVLKHDFYNMKKKDRNKRNVQEDEIEQIAAIHDILNEYLEKEERKWLYQAIYQLPEKEREVMLLTIQLDSQDEEISRITGLSVSNVRVIRHRAKQKLIKSRKEETR